MEQQNLSIQDDSNDKRYFTIIPNYILNHSTLWDREVYIQMKRIAGESGSCWTSRTELSKQCGMSLGQLKKSIKYLLEKEWIKHRGMKLIPTKGGMQSVNNYKITDLWNLNNKYYEEKFKGGSQDDTPTLKGGSQEGPKGGHGKAKGGSQDDDKEEPYNNITIKEELATTSVAGKEINQVIDLFKSINPSYQKFFGNKTQRAAAERLLGKVTLGRLVELAVFLPKTNKMQFAPKIYSPLELEDKLGKIVDFITTEKLKVGNKKPLVGKVR